MNVHFEGTLKRNYTVDSVFRKCETNVKKTGVCKKWTLSQTDDTVTVDFGDGTQLTLLFSGKNFDGYCPTEHDSEQPIDKKSADYAKCRLLYGLKSLCREYTVTDEGTAWNRYLESMKYKAHFRRLTDDETETVRQYVDSGVNPLNLLSSVLYRTLKLRSMDEYKALGQAEGMYGGYDEAATRWEQWLVRTCLFKGERTHLMWQQSGGMDPVSLAIAGFAACLNEMHILIQKPDHKFTPRSIFGAPHGILRRMLYDDFVPAIKAEADDLEKCMLVYRVFVSALEYTGFTYVGLADAEE